MERWRRVAATLAVYTGVVAWLSWPLTARLATHLPDTNLSCLIDGRYAVWALAWETHALATAPATLFDANIYHPARHALAYGPTAFGALPLFAPVFLATGNPALAMNLTFLGGIVLTAFGLHRVVALWTGSELGGLIAAWTFLTARWTLWAWLPTVPYTAVIQHLPWIVFLAASPSGGRGRWFALTVLIVLQSLTDPVYVAPAVFAPLAVLGAVRLLRRSQRAAGLRLCGALAVVAATLAPLYAVYYGVQRAAPDLAARTVWRAPPETLAALGLPVVGGAPLPMSPPPWSGLDNAGPLGVARAIVVLIPLGLGLRIASRRGFGSDVVGRGWRHAVLWTAVGTVISTAAVGTLGHAVVLPHFALLARVAPGVLSVIRSVWRLGVAGLVGLALLAGLAFAECEAWLGRRWRRAPVVLAALVVALVHLEYRNRVPSTYPLTAAGDGDTPIVRALRAPGGPLLELPVPDEGQLAEPQTRAMYRSIFHWRPLLNGYSSYFPAGFRERMALAARLPDPEALAALRRDTGLAAILVHLGPGLPNASAWRQAAEAGAGDALAVVARDGTDVLFDVR